MAEALIGRATGQAGAAAVPTEIQLVMTDRTLLAGDHTPGVDPRSRAGAGRGSPAADRRPGG